MFILYTIVDKCNHCSPVNTSSIADGIFNSLNKVFIYLFNSFALTFQASRKKSFRGGGVLENLKIGLLIFLILNPRHKQNAIWNPAKGVGELTSNFLRGGGMDVFWNDPLRLRQNHWKIIGKNKKLGFCVVYSVATYSFILHS
jgi:hypothetical protein